MRRLCGVLAGLALVAPTCALADGAQAITRDEAIQVFLADDRVSRWLERYDDTDVEASAERSSGADVWRVSATAGGAGTIASGEVGIQGDLRTVFVGPQVAWDLARGKGVGGAINEPSIWLAFSLFFLIGLANLRRPLSLQNLDVLALLSLSAYLAYFNAGRVFASAIAAAASLAYLIVRCGWIGVTNRASPFVSSVPVWLLVAGLVFLGGLRVGLNVFSPHTLDVSYAGVIGADRLASGETPYGNFPEKKLLFPCGPANASGEISDWVQDSGRCETANPLGDTYGPVNYHAYLPGLWLFGWSGKWDSLPAVHFTTILFDLIAMLGMAAIGWRYGRKLLAVTLAFAWIAYPFTQYVVSSNSNDTIMAALLIWGFWAATSPVGRGSFVALASWTKMAALIVVPLWLTYPARALRPGVAFAAAFALTTVLAFWVMVLSGDPLHELRVFYERTFEIQAERDSPFSLWDWGDYHAAGLPDLKIVQRLLQICLVLAAITVALIPRRKTPLQLASFTAALLLAFELTLTHWAATYVVWFFPFALLAMFASGLQGDATTSPRELRPTLNDAGERVACG